MITKTVKRGRDIDLEAIATWNNEGGAPRLLKRGANRSRRHDTVEFEVHGDKELAFRPVTQAAPDPRREDLAASVSYDLWRFSCEMPDAPHLCDSFYATI
jgi:hypothetical protein